MNRHGESVYRDRRPGSAALHAIDEIASRPLVALVVVSLDLLWVILTATFGFPQGLDSVFQTLVAAVTLAMVFVIQHTQSREQVVVQRKLDAIISALPEADQTLIASEDASDDKLADAQRAHRQRRDEAGQE
jgi:low affinity Fe/Cu permease